MMTAGLTMVAVIGVGRKGTQWDLRSYFDPIHLRGRLFRGNGCGCAFSVSEVAAAR